MTEQLPGEQTETRGGDRRGSDRRRVDRRLPAPPWRRPWAYASYGLLAGLVMVLLLTRPWNRERPEPDTLETTTALPAVDTARLPAAQSPVQEATSVGDYERLLAQGEAVSGQRVRTVLYCNPINSVSLVAGTRISPSIASLADAGGRVPGAECEWGRDSSAPKFFLLVPAALAERFAAMPEVEIGFVRRRRVTAEVEWIGRSDALALRIVGVLRAVQ